MYTPPNPDKTPQIYFPCPGNDENNLSPGMHGIKDVANGGELWYKPFKNLVGDAEPTPILVATAADIATNAGNISTNTTNISTNATSVETLEQLAIESSITIPYQGRQIVAIGDSNTAGLLPDRDSWTTTYTTLCSGVGVRNFSIVGDTTQGVIDNQLQDALDYSEGKVIVMAGTNDVDQSFTETTIKTNLEIIYKALLAENKTPVAVGILPLQLGVDKAKIDSINDWIENESSASIFIDTATYFDDGTGKLITAYDSGDGVHLNAAGQALLAQVIFDVSPTIPYPNIRRISDIEDLSSENFLDSIDVSTWTTLNTSTTSGEIAPDGTSTAYGLIADATVGFHTFVGGSTGGGLGKRYNTIWVKNGTGVGDWIRLYNASTGTAVKIRITDGAIYTTADFGGGTAGFIPNLIDDWGFYWASCFPSSDGEDLHILIGTIAESNQFAGDNVNPSFYVWQPSQANDLILPANARIEQSEFDRLLNSGMRQRSDSGVFEKEVSNQIYSIAPMSEATDADNITGAKVENISLSKKGSGLTFEIQENIEAKSEVLNSTVWSLTNLTLDSATGISSPIPGVDYIGLKGSAATTQEYFIQSFVAPLTERRTYRRFFKEGALTWVLYATSDFTRYAYFDVVNCVVGNTNGDVNTSITKVKNGVLVQMDLEIAAGTHFMRTFLSDGNGVSNATGDGTTINMYVTGMMSYAGYISDEYAYTPTDELPIDYKTAMIRNIDRPLKYDAGELQLIDQSTEYLGWEKPVESDNTTQYSYEATAEQKALFGLDARVMVFGALGNGDTLTAATVLHGGNLFVYDESSRHSSDLRFVSGASYAYVGLSGVSGSGTITVSINGSIGIISGHIIYTP